MTETLHELASLLGIADHFCDAGIKRCDYEVSDKTLRFFTRALGYPADTPKQAQNSLIKLQNARWRKMLEPIYVRVQGDVTIDVVSPDLSDISLTAIAADHRRIPLDYTYLKDTASRALFYRESLRINTPLDIGYYDLEVQAGGKTAYSKLAIAPQTCCSHSSDQHKLYGFAIQLYALRSQHNWGIGDFSDLSEFVRLCAAVKADVIGINPINVLYHHCPENASPYMSISRTFLNPIYIDVENLPEFSAADKAEIAADIERLRSEEIINYNDVYNLKIKMLERCWQRFCTAKSNSPRRQAYAEFCDKYGSDLDNLALFEAIYEHECASGRYFNDWSKTYPSPQCGAAQSFRSSHPKRIEFFKFLQFEAFRQFDLVQQQISSCGLAIGLYRDLAVGVGRDSAEVWSNPDLFMSDCGTGAPPDAFFPSGQKWGLGTFNPLKLKEQAYAPFIKILRANMQAGALRIDHVMSLMRLYVVPDADERGTYLYYNFDDMLNLVVLESALNNCVVAGESIGNVPEGFLEKLAQKNIYSLNILWAERWGCGQGDFKQPQCYPANAFTSVGTHDMAPLKMWWFGYDIETNFQVGIIASEADKIAAYHLRENDRCKLLDALDAAKVWPLDRPRRGDYIYGEGYPEGIEEAVERFVARSSSPVYLAQLEDILHVTVMQNLPGTDKDRHPNWRRKLPVPLERLADDAAFIRCVAAIRSER
ncbi:MAG: 4-alpha-glucanotransferase [Alphaproteobacteria bacterium]|nr:4-alpha-glucanotransferase [Alphaproteobacteria bacterium]